MRLKRLVLLLGTFLLTFSVKGQRDFFNLQAENPAYAGAWGTTGIISSTNFDLWGDEVALKQILSFQSILNSSVHGIGLNIYHESIGVERRNSVFANYSYSLKVSQETSVRVGINGGVLNYHINSKKVELYPDGTADPEFQSNINEYIPNFGLGIYLSSARYYFGVSLPKFLENKYDHESRTLYSAGGVIVNLSDNLAIKPSFRTQSNTEKPFEYDLLANILINKKIWLGGFYRSINSIGAIVEWIGFRNFRIGYVFDYHRFNKIEGINRTSHEIMGAYSVKNLFPKYY